MRRTLITMLLLVTAGPTGMAFAQASSPSGQGDPGASARDAPGLDDIVVTAQKRSESVQKIPLAVTALGGEQMRQSGINSVGAVVASVPSLKLGQSLGSANVTLRGVSLTALNFGVENPVAFHVDGVYIARPAAVLSGFYDMQRVEVLRGAQGTLYGRNATGGSINLITAEPTSDLSGYGQFTYGRYNHMGLEGGLGGPLGSDKLRFRLAFRTDDRDGWGKNEATGRDIDDNEERAIRGKLQFLPTEDLTITLSADYYRATDHQTAHDGGTQFGGPRLGTVLLGGTSRQNLRNISSENDPFRRNRIWGSSATVNYEMGDVTLRSITAYRRTKALNVVEFDGTDAPLMSTGVLRDDARQFSQEIQLVGTHDRFNWILGGYYFRERDRGAQAISLSTAFLSLPTAPFPGIAVSSPYETQGYFSGSQIKTEAYAVFGQFTYKATPELSLTVGGRYSIETKEQINQGALDLATPFDRDRLIYGQPARFSTQCAKKLPTIGYPTAADCDPDRTFKAFTPKVSVEYQVTPAALLYASYTRGFKSGTYNFGVPAGAVGPENLDDFEIGAKSTFLDGALRVNVAGFYYNYKDLQVYNNLFLSVILENAASAKIKGLEAEIVAKPTRNIQFDLNGSYLYARYSSFISADQLRPQGDGVTIDKFGQPAFNLKGNSLPQAPDFSGRAGASYTVFAGIGNFTLRGEAVYNSRIYFTQFNNGAAQVGKRTRFNASLRYDGSGQFKGIYASVNAKNLANKVRATNGFVTTGLTGGIVAAYLEDPMTIDLTVGYRF